MPSALGAWAVESWVVFGLDFDASTVDGELVWSVAHEKGGFEVVGDGETFFLGSLVTGETDVDGGWVGEFQWSSDSAKGVTPAGFRVDNQSISAILIDSLNIDFNIFLTVRVGQVPAALLVGRVPGWVVFRFDRTGSTRNSSQTTRSFLVITFCRGNSGNNGGRNSSQPCWGQSSEQVVVIVFPVAIVAIVL